MKGQGILFQILAVTGKLSALENMIERKVRGSRSSIHKSTQERKIQQKEVTRIQFEGWTSSLLREVKLGPSTPRTDFL